MNDYFFRPKLRDLTKGARLEFIRVFRCMERDEVTEYFGFGGKDPNRTIRNYEDNSVNPLPPRMKELIELYHVSIDAIRDYDLTDPIDLVYIAMWEEELMPFFDINIDNIASKLSDYGKCVLEGLKEWKEMKEKRENGEISTHDYIEWKLNFEINNKFVD